MRAGVTLIELIVTITCGGIVAAIAVPHLTSISDAAAVRDETFRVVAALDASRGAAVRLNSVTTLTLSSAAYRAVATVGADSVVAWTDHGTRSGVALAGTGQPLLFGPAGLAMGVSNRTITLTKGMALRRVVVSKLGRLTY